MISSMYASTRLRLREPHHHPAGWFNSQCSIHISITMRRNDSLNSAVTTDGAASDLLGPNALTAAGALVGAGTAVAGGMILATAMPVQVIGSTGIAAGLYFAGTRQADGKPIIPFIGNKADDAVEPAAA